MKTTVLVLIIALLLSIAGNVYFFKKEKAYKEQSDSYFAEIEQRIKEHVAWTEMAQVRIDSIHSKRLADSLLFKSREKHLKSSVASLKEKLTHLPKVFPLIPSNSGELDSIRVAFYTKDTVILKQDSLIATLDGQIYDQAKSFTAELEQKDLQLQATNQTSDLWREAAENAEKQTRKEKRKTKFWKIASGVITLGAIFLLAK